MSKETLEYHWGKHHRAYVENLNKQIEGTELDGMTLESIISTSYNQGDILPAFNNAAQIWNHDFFWESMKPGGGGKPSGELLELINRDFGSFEGLINKFKSAATTQFGSGWAWLVYKEHKLDVPNARNPRPSEEDNKHVVVKSPNAVNPLVWEYHPLLTLDVWENELLNEEAASSCSPAEIYLKKLCCIPGHIKGRAALTKHILATENIRMELELEKNKSKALKEEVKRMKEEQVKFQEEQTKFKEEQAKFKEEQMKVQEGQKQMKDKVDFMMTQLLKITGSQN